MDWFPMACEPLEVHVERGQLVEADPQQDTHEQAMKNLEAAQLRRLVGELPEREAARRALALRP